MNSFSQKKPKRFNSVFSCFAGNHSNSLQNSLEVSDENQKFLASQTAIFSANSFKKKFFQGYSKVHELKLVSIGLASPEKIQTWAEKQLPNGKIFGEVTNANTFHYRTFQPTKGGLFCERIFGPMKDFECACGKRQKPTSFESKQILEHKQTKRYFCSNCDVEYTWSILRRYQLGYMKFHAPVTHLWYLKTNPSSLSIFFDMKRKDLEAIVYCMDSLTLENMWKLAEQKGNFHQPISDLYKIWQNSLRFQDKKKSIENRFRQKKQQKKIFRKKFFEICCVDLSQRSSAKSTNGNEIESLETNWQFVQKKSFFQVLNSKKILKKNNFSMIEAKFLPSFRKNGIFSESEVEKNPMQKKIFQNVFDETQKKIFFFLFEESLQKVLQKIDANQNFENFFQQKLSDQTLRDSFFPFFQQKIFFSKFEKKNLWILWFFLLKFSFFFAFQSKKENFQKIWEKKVFGEENLSLLEKKKFFLLFFTIFPFFQKIHSKKREIFQKQKVHSFLQKSFFQKHKEYFVFLKKIPCNFEIFFSSSDWKKRNDFFSFSIDPNFNSHDFPDEKIEKNQIMSQQNGKVSAKKRSLIEIWNFPNGLKKKRMEKKKKIQLEEYQKFLTFDAEKKRKQMKEFHISKFLKNPVSTLSYNFLWKNDSDWNSFLSYNSFSVSNFHDIPIFYFSSREVFFSSSTKFFSPQISSISSFQKPGMKSNFSQSSLFDQRNSKEIPEFFSFQASSHKFSVGAGIIEKFLAEYTVPELQKMIKQHQILLPKLQKAIHQLKEIGQTKKDSVKIQRFFQKRENIVRRLKFLRKFFRKNSNPTFMILRNFPVLPPDLRPILKLQNQIAASDLNRFYQRILYRNERLKKFSKDSVPHQSFEIRYAQRLLQEAVDNLIQNGKGGVKPETNSRGQPLKSLSEILKGKQGRFRQYLLGKRVDYSGRSVIVVGPKFKLHECGLPKEMAFELFLPFLIQQILQLNLTKTVLGAKNLLKKDSDLAFHLLNKIMKNIPVLLNRAPTLHKLGFQAFFPKLVEGRAILLHPMLCPGFNADFDGDQMAVHIPLTVEARTEAWKFMLSTNNFLNSATGEPILLPTQDMVLGCYYLTTDFQAKGSAFEILNAFRKNTSTNFTKFQISNKSFLFFQNIFEVFSAYNRNQIGLHTPVWIRWNALIDFGKMSTKPREIQLKKNGYWSEIHPKFCTFFTQKNENVSKFIRTTPGKILMNLKIQDFEKKIP